MFAAILKPDAIILDVKLIEKVARLALVKQLVNKQEAL